MTKSVAPPARYWAIQKDGASVQKHETVAERLESISYVIPESCDTAQMSKEELRQTSRQTSVLTDKEKQILGI